MINLEVDGDIECVFLFLFYLFIYFCPTKCTKKERKNTLQKESGKESLNRNHKAYNKRLPWLQLTPDGYTCTAMTINSKEQMKIQ